MSETARDVVEQWRVWEADGKSYAEIARLANEAYSCVWYHLRADKAARRMSIFPPSKRDKVREKKREYMRNYMRRRRAEGTNVWE